MSSSSSSDSDEFYDAEETPSQSARKQRKSSNGNVPKRSNSEPNVLATLDNKSKHQGPLSLGDKNDNYNPNAAKDSSQAVQTALSARQKFKELRQKLQNDDEEGSGNVTPPGNSQTSSVEGVFAASQSRPSQHKFRVIEQDTISLQSINSVGRVMRLINNNQESARKTASVSALSSSSLDSESTQSSTKKFPSTFTLSGAQTVSQEKTSPTTLQEPDVIASTKSSNWPVAPPRRKKRNRGGSTAPITKSASSATFTNSSDLASPASTIESLTRDFEHSLDRIPSTSPVKFDSSTIQKPSELKDVSRQKIDHCKSKHTDGSHEKTDHRTSIQTDVSHQKTDHPKSVNTDGLNKNDLSSHKTDKYLKSDRNLGSDDSRSSTLRSGNSLDISQALKGKFVVKPQDTESLKAQSVAINTGVIKPIIPEEIVKDRRERRSAASEAQDTLSSERKWQDSKGNSLRRLSTRSGVGHYSLGPHRGTHQGGSKHSSRDRRKSAGDENLIYDANIKVRTHTNSGKQLSDLEILEQVTVLNLDTGERIPLSAAEDKLPQCINPLSLHIMRLTSEYVSSSSMDKDKESDEESVDTNKKSDIPAVDDIETGSVRKKTAKLKRFLGSTVKKTMHKAKSIAHEVSHARHKEDTIDIVDNVHPGEQNYKLKASNSHKGPLEFEKIEHVQELKDGTLPIWCMKFSTCGRLLATAGQDKILKIWVVRDAYPFFQDMRTKYNAEKVSPTPSQESLVSHNSTDTATFAAFEALSPDEAGKYTFMPKPFCTYSGHTSDLLDVAWSKNYFILSSSFDKTVRLWHISRKECLCCFQHIDFVSAIVFHPRDDRYFLSGSLDGKLRLWNIPDKKVAVWNEVEGNPKLITAANFCQNGKFAVVGTYDGRCIFYITDQLKYHTQIHVRSSRGRNAVGRKISGIEPMPGEDKILVTSNDSRIRLYDLRDLNVSCKYKGKGYMNVSSQIKASFSHDGKYIITGSEKWDIYIWKTNHDYSKFSSVRKDRNDFWEAIKAHNAVVTCAVFAPNPEPIIKMLEDSQNQNKNQDSDTSSQKFEDPVVEQHTKNCSGYVLVSADFNGCIKVFINKTKPKHSSLPVSALA